MDLYEGEEETEDESGNIFEACTNGFADSLLAAIERGEDINASNSSNQTPLMYASCESSKDHLLCMRILIMNGVNVNARDDIHRTALHYAANNNYHAIHLLLDNGANINATTINNDTPLYTAVYENKLNYLTACWKAKVLLERGADLSIPSLLPRHEGNTCLHEATFQLNIEMIQLLFEYGAEDTVLNVCIYICISAIFIIYSIFSK